MQNRRWGDLLVVGVMESKVKGLRGTGVIGSLCQGLGGCNTLSVKSRIVGVNFMGACGGPFQKKYGISLSKVFFQCNYQPESGE